MSKLYDFLIEMSKDLKLQEKFAMDSNAVMDDAGLTAEEQKAILSGDLDEIYSAGGSKGLVICKTIWVFDPNQPKKKK